MGVAFLFLASMVLPAIGIIAGALATVLIILAWTAVGLAIVIAGVRLYITIRDRPVYQAMQRDIDESFRLHARITAPSERLRLPQDTVIYDSTVELDTPRELY